MANLDTPVNNTPYSDEELEHFKNLLLEQRKEAMENSEQIKESITKSTKETNTEGNSSQDHHPGDIGTEEQQKETSYILRERTRQKIEQIDAALKRIENKTYGVCEDTGKKIQKGRLEAIPYARFSLEARKKDETKHQGPKT